MRDRPPAERAPGSELASLVADKRRLRDAMGARRRSLPLRTREQAGSAIARVVLGLAEYERAERVAAYVSYGGEAPTGAILDAVLASGRALLLPRVTADGLQFARVDDLQQLIPSRWGVREPPADSAGSPLAPGDLVLLPGLAFDARGRRLGRGGGHYDRTLADAGAEPFCIGIAYAFQLVEAVPTADHDRSVQGIATESGFVRALPEPRDPICDPG